jgi:hypothetical protein
LRAWEETKVVLYIYGLLCLFDLTSALFCHKIHKSLQNYIKTGLLLMRTVLTVVLVHFGATFLFKKPLICSNLGSVLVMRMSPTRLLPPLNYYVKSANFSLKMNDRLFFWGYYFFKIVAVQWFFLEWRFCIIFHPLYSLGSKQFVLIILTPSSIDLKVSMYP